MIVFPQIDPVALSLGPFQIRWYALAYLAGFLGGLFYGRYLVRLEPGRRPNALDIENLLPWMVLGVILGGRLGYVLFYNLGYYLTHPLHALAVWEGGMSFHGGLLGVAAVIILYARHHKFSALALGDVVSAVVPIGLFFGRLANFINGELFGRPTDAPFGMVFPLGGDVPRHPSQLYEAFLEGVVLFVVLSWLYRRADVRRRPGFVFGALLAGYGLCRFLVEYVREPDVQLGLFFDVISMGQIMCLPMILAGGILIAYARKHPASA